MTTTKRYVCKVCKDCNDKCVIEITGTGLGVPLNCPYSGKATWKLISELCVVCEDKQTNPELMMRVCDECATMIIEQIQKGEGIEALEGDR